LELCLLFRFEVESALKYETKEDLRIFLSDIIECRNKEIDNFLNFYDLAFKIHQITVREASNLGNRLFKLKNLSIKQYFYIVDTVSLIEELSSYKNHDEVNISDFCQVIDEQSIKSFLKTNQDQQKTILQQRILCFKSIKPEKINLAKTLVELAQNKTINIFLKKSLIEFIELKEVIQIFFLSLLN
jgi:hypothetical protein